MRVLGQLSLRLDTMYLNRRRGENQMRLWVGGCAKSMVRWTSRIPKAVIFAKTQKTLVIRASGGTTSEHTPKEVTPIPTSSTKPDR